jgi:flavodoxin
MADTTDHRSALARRDLLMTGGALMAAPLLATGACAQEGAAPAPGPRRLVAYVTRSGNTRVIAGTLHRALQADLVEIRPAQPYPEDYETHVAQAARESASGYEPPLAPMAARVENYDEIFLGFPIWGETAPPPIRSFLRAHDLCGKVVRPFITHGGYGVGRSLSVLSGHAPGARIQAPFVMEADQERRTLNQVNIWLGQIKG